jgi:hypothetical protein
VTEYCGRCGRGERVNEHFSYHSGIVSSTHICPECEKIWHKKIPSLRGKPDSEWQKEFSKFLMKDKEKVQFT